MIDQKWMAQVFVNLLSNAIKFSPQKSTITIEIAENRDLKTGQDILSLSVTDQGVGIPKDELDKVFDKFVQSSKHRSKAGGTGLGLPITKKIITLHHGRIWAESPPVEGQQGTVFHINMPRHPEMPAKMEFSVEGIDNAITAHTEWLHVIENIVMSPKNNVNMPVSLVSNEHICSLGQWIDQELTDTEKYKGLLETHKRFHEVTGECIAYYQHGNMKKADALKLEMYELSEAVQSALNNLKKDVVS